MFLHEDPFLPRKCEHLPDLVSDSDLPSISVPKNHSLQSFLTSSTSSGLCLQRRFFTRKHSFVSSQKFLLIHLTLTKPAVWASPCPSRLMPKWSQAAEKEEAPCLLGSRPLGSSDMGLDEHTDSPGLCCRGFPRPSSDLVTQV